MEEEEGVVEKKKTLHYSHVVGKKVIAWRGDFLSISKQAAAGVRSI